MSTPLAMGRTALVGSFPALLALVAPSAGAASGDIEFSCRLADHPGDDGVLPIIEGMATGSFDTAIPDGLVVSAPTSVDMAPFTGSMTFTDEFTDQLRAAGVRTLEVEYQAEGAMPLRLFLGDEGASDDEGLGFIAVFSPSGGTVPADGPLSMEFEGWVADSESWYNPRSFPLRDAGTGTVTGYVFWVDYYTQDDQVFSLYCEPDERFLIDTVEVLAVARPTLTSTPTPSPSASPVRPMLVQTDFAEGVAEGDSTAVAPMLGVGALLTLAAAAAAGRGHRGSRRH